MTKLQKRFDEVANEYAQLFIKKQTPDEDAKEFGFDPIEWVGDESGDILYLLDCFISYKDIRTDIDQNAPIGEIFNYYDYIEKRSYLNLRPDITYQNWLRGAPRMSDKELNHLLDMKNAFEEALHEYEEYKEE